MTKERYKRNAPIIGFDEQYLKDENSFLTDKVDSLHRVIDNRDRFIHKIQDENENLHKTIDALEKKVENLDGTSNGLRVLNIRDRKDKEIADLEAQLKHQHSKHKDLTFQIDQLEREKANVSRFLNLRDERIKQLETRELELAAKVDGGNAAETKIGGNGTSGSPLSAENPFNNIDNEAILTILSRLNTADSTIMKSHISSLYRTIDRLEKGDALAVVMNVEAIRIEKELRNRIIELESQLKHQRSKHKDLTFQIDQLGREKSNAFRVLNLHDERIKQLETRELELAEIIDGRK